MLVTSHTSINAYADDRWVISTPLCNLLVNTATAELFQLLRESDTMEQALSRFNEHFAHTLPREQFTQLLQNSFGGRAILSQDTSPDPAAPDQGYIKLRVEFLSARVAGVLARPLQPLYTPRLFCFVLGAQALVLLGTYVLTPALPVHSQADYWIAAPLFYASIVVHELGHIAACARFGVKHGGVGFGLYAYLFPVLYADITNVWAGSRAQRLIANMGGIYAQLLFAGALGAGYLATHYVPLQLAATATSVSALWQLNPFVRHDGYWMLSDLTSTPNLLPRATELVRQGLSRAGVRRVVTTRGRVLRTRKTWLLLYGLTNASILALFAGYTLSAHGRAILAFPELLLSLTSKAATGQLQAADFSMQQVVVVAFYTMLIRFGLSARRRFRARALPLTA